MEKIKLRNLAQKFRGTLFYGVVLKIMPVNVSSNDQSMRFAEHQIQQGIKMSDRIKELKSYEQALFT